MGDWKLLASVRREHEMRPYNWQTIQIVQPDPDSDDRMLQFISAWRSNKGDHGERKVTRQFRLTPREAATLADALRPEIVPPEVFPSTSRTLTRRRSWLRRCWLRRAEDSNPTP